MTRVSRGGISRLTTAVEELSRSAFLRSSDGDVLRPLDGALGDHGDLRLGASGKRRARTLTATRPSIMIHRRGR